MKTFKEFAGLVENTNTTQGMASPDLVIGGMKRDQLPNIVDHNAFIKDITESGVKLYTDVCAPCTLKPSQNEFNKDKVEKFKQSNDFTKAILISNDNIIVDGHHRWKAAQESNNRISVNKIDLTFESIYSFLNNKPYIKQKELHEGVK